MIIVDSSSSEVEEVNELDKHMDVIVLDHHNIEESDEELNAILVNPKQVGCMYPNKDISGSGVVYRLIEVLDYHYRKVNIKNYLDIVGLTILSDQMDMTNLENRYFVSQGLKRIVNVGLLALIKATRNDESKVDSQIMNFDIIPILNTATRNNEMKKAFSLLFEKDYFKALDKAKTLVNDNKTRKETVKKLYNDYKKIVQDEKFSYVNTPDATKNYNGLVAQKFASDRMKPAFVLKDNGESYQGSYRSYNGFDLQEFLKQCPYVEYAAGHAQAGGTEIKHENWDKFKQYVNDNIDESLFEPVIEYDIELSEEELTKDLIDEILEFDEIWGNGSSKITVRVNDVFVEDREVFPPKSPSHVKIIADNFEMLKFNDSEYADEIESWDSISIIGTLGKNNYKGVVYQLFLEDYVEHE